MICPVCEHPQDFGLECEVCGKDLADLGGLAGLGAPPTAVQPVEGLEVTVGDRIGAVPVERVGELEATHFDAVVAPVERVPEMEAFAPVGEVPVEPLLDLSPDREPDDGVRTEVPGGPVTCRYCRNVQAQGGLCDRCGMKLPRAAGAAPAAKAPRKGLPERVRCRSCGAPGVPGERCGECGRSIASLDE